MSLFGPPNIAKLKEKGKIPELIKALHYDKDGSKTRIEAINALVDLHGVEAAASIADLLNLGSGMDIDLSLTCALALGHIGSAAQVPALVQTLNCTQYEENLEKLLVLKRTLFLKGQGFSYDDAEKLAQDWIKARYRYMHQLRMVACKALGNIADVSAIPALKEARQDPCPVVASFAADALRAIEEPEVAKTHLPPQTEMVQELIDLLDFYTDIQIFYAIQSLTPGKTMDHQAISTQAVKDAVEVFSSKYHFIGQTELDDILGIAVERSKTRKNR